VREGKTERQREERGECAEGTRRLGHNDVSSKSDVVSKQFNLFGLPQNSDVVIYYIYIGHGDKESTWNVGDESVTFNEFFKEWTTLGSALKNNLLIICDSCHSNDWVKDLAKSETLQEFPICIQGCSDGKSYSSVLVPMMFGEDTEVPGDMRLDLFATPQYKNEQKPLPLLLVVGKAGVTWSLLLAKADRTSRKK